MLTGTVPEVRRRFSQTLVDMNQNAIPCRQLFTEWR
jgi:hypothetical protein